MLAVQFVRSLPGYALVRASRGHPAVATGDLSMLHLGDVEEPQVPGPGWVRVRPRLSGICGSDLSAITGHASRYLDLLTSYPFVPGHEVVGVLDDGTRVVVEPALGCCARGLSPACRSCAEGRPGGCERVTEGVVGPGLQIGYCADTGGGWGEVLVAHESQLHPVPAGLPDEAAVLIEPLACCVHAVLQGRASPDDVVVVQGAGTIGLLTVAAVRRLTPPRRLICVAKHPVQREHAVRLGADQVVTPDRLFQRLRFATGARRLGNPDRPLLLGGVDLAFECTGSGRGLDDAVRFTRAGGRIVCVGMPGREEVDWAPIWQRELNVTGSYAYGTERDGRRTFELALEIAPELGLERLTGPLFPLGEYQRAVAYAHSAGRLGAVKVAFDLRSLAGPD